MVAVPEPMTRELPPPCEARTPLCSLCGAETVFDGTSRLECGPCGAWWPSRDYWLEDGQWADEGAQACGARIRPWLGSTDFPHIANDVLACVLTAGHTPATKHRCADWDWSDDDADGYLAVRNVHVRHVVRGTDTVALTAMCVCSIGCGCSGYVEGPLDSRPGSCDCWCHDARCNCRLHRARREAAKGAVQPS